MAFIDIERLFRSEDISEILSIWKKFGVVKFDSKMDKMVFGIPPFAVEFIKHVKRNSNANHIFPRVLSLPQFKFDTARELMLEINDIIGEVCDLYRSSDIPFSVYFLLHMLTFNALDESISVANCRFNPFQVITVSQKVLDWTNRINSTYPLEPDSLLIDGFNPLIITPNGFGVVKGKSAFLFPLNRGVHGKTIHDEFDLLKRTVALIDLGVAVVENNQLKMTAKNAAIFEEAEQYPDDENEWWVKWHVRLQPVGVGRKETALVPVRGHFRHRAA